MLTRIRHILRLPSPPASGGDAVPAAVFKLRLWFGVTAFCVIAAMGGLFGTVLTDFLGNRMLQREAEVTRDFLESILWAEESGPAVFSVKDTGPNPYLMSFAQHIRTMPDVLRGNVYAMNGQILWSTDPVIIGRRFQDNHELDAAFKGSLVIEIGMIAADPKSEHESLPVASRTMFVEAYMPLRDRKGNVLGVVELYKVPTALNATIREGRIIIWAGVIVGLLLLFLTLFWIVQRGARLIQHQQIELGRMAALAALGQMASAIAHSLRNPLAGVRGSAELLRLEHAGTDEAARDIISQVDRMDMYVKELLDYVRSDGHSAQEIDPRDVVQGTLARLRPLLDQAGIAVAVLDERRAPDKVLADPQLLSQALGNVITNAVEAMGHGGGLAVVLARSGRFVGMTITDSGPGIPQDVRDRVADAFFTTKTRGLGLGLALSRQILERFGGTLEIAPPPPAGGASVRLTLPIAAAS